MAKTSKSQPKIINSEGDVIQSDSQSPAATDKKEYHRKLVLCDEDVEELASVGLIQPEIATILKCSEDTLQRNYRVPMESGWNKRNSSLRRKQYELAVAGNVTMLIWLGKNLLNQSDKLQHTGADGGAVQIQVDRESLLGKLLGN